MVQMKGALLSLGVIISLASSLFCTSRADTAAASVDCQEMLVQLWSNYTNPAYITESCDEGCLDSCEQTLQKAITTTKSRLCPPQADIAKCFNLFSGEWQHYASECELFSSTPAPTTASGEGTEASADPTSPTFSPPPPPPKVDSSAEGEGGSRRLYSSDGEGSDGAPTAPSSLAGNSTSNSSSSSSAEGGSQAVATVSGCFPQFTTMDDFRVYMKGDYWITEYNAPSNTVGIILSVFFWVGLAAMGLYLRH